MTASHSTAAASGGLAYLYHDNFAVEITNHEISYPNMKF